MKRLWLTFTACMLPALISGALAQPVLIELTPATLQSLNKQARAFTGKECRTLPTPTITVIDSVSKDSPEVLDYVFAMSKAMLSRQAAAHGITVHLLKADTHSVVIDGVRMARLTALKQGKEAFNLLSLQPYNGSQHLILYACSLQ